MEIITKKSIVLFIPEAGIYPYLRSLVVLADAVKKNGGKVYIVHNTGQMVRSPMEAMYRLSPDASIEERERLDKISQKLFKSAQKKYNYSVIELSDLMDVTTKQSIDDLTNISQDKLENLIFRGIAVGKISQYDFSLETKTQIYPNLSESHKALYTAYIKNTILSIILTEKICVKYNPSTIITFNQYAQGQGVRAIATTHKVNFLSITAIGHKNADFSRLIPYERLNIWFSHCMKWSEIKDVSILPHYVSECWDDSLFHFYGSGSHIFSSRKHNDPESVFKKIGLDPAKRTAVVYTSSNDERSGYEKLLKEWGDEGNFVDAFPSQIAWLSWLREYVAKREDIQIVVRIHPREGERQFGFGSSHLDQLKVAFTENSKSFFIIWPDDQISSYDLMESADLCLVPWTTMGQEAARVGIPVLSCTGNMYYPDDDFMQVATTLEEYKKRLDLMINFEFTWQHLVKAVRFYHWRTFVPSLDLGETVPVDVLDYTIWPEAPASKIQLINDIFFNKKDVVEYNVRKWRESLAVDALEKESEAMRQGIRYFLDKVFYPPFSYERTFGILYRIYRKIRKTIFHLVGKKTFRKQGMSYSFNDFSLEVSVDILNLPALCQKTKKNRKLRIIVIDGQNAILINNGKILCRKSSMVIRLAKLYVSSFKNKK